MENEVKEASESAPDLDKIKAYIKAIASIKVPTMSTETGTEILLFVVERINQLGTDTMEEIDNARN